MYSVCKLYMHLSLVPCTLFTCLHAGTYEMNCNVADHLNAGMRALYTVTGTDNTVINESGVTREYFISADVVEWDYAPKQYVRLVGADGRGQATLWCCDVACHMKGAVADGTARVKAHARMHPTMRPDGTHNAYVPRGQR